STAVAGIATELTVIPPSVDHMMFVGERAQTKVWPQPVVCATAVKGPRPQNPASGLNKPVRPVRWTTAHCVAATAPPSAVAKTDETAWKLHCPAGLTRTSGLST